jgi:hypothetical protein
MIQALASNRTNHGLDIYPLPGGSRGGKDFVDSHAGYLSAEVIAVDGIAIAQQVSRELVKGKGFPQLLSRPLGGGVGRHVAVKNASDAAHGPAPETRKEPGNEWSVQ